MGPFEGATGQYYELRGRLATGQLSAQDFAAAIDGLLLRHAGRYWRLVPESGQWQVYETGQWRASDPAAPPPRSGGSVIPPVLPVVAVALLLVGLLWWDPPRLPVAPMAGAEVPPLAGAAPILTGTLPDSTGGALVVEQAFQLLAGRTLTSTDFEVLKPVLSWEARLRPWAIQFLRWPERQHLRLVAYEPANVDPITTPVLRAQAVGVYEAEGSGGHVRVRWAFTLVPEDDEWRIKSIALAGLQGGDG